MRKSSRLGEKLAERDKSHTLKLTIVAMGSNNKCMHTPTNVYD